MSDHAQQSILQELERLLQQIRRLEVDIKATADEKAATTEAAIGKQLAKVLARDAALQRETEQARAARKRVAAAKVFPIIEAIRAAPHVRAAPQATLAIEPVADKPVAIEPVAAEPVAIEKPLSLLDRLAALPNRHKKTLLTAGFTYPVATIIDVARSLGSKTKDPKYAVDVVAKHLKAHRAESLSAADLAAALPEPNIALSSSESPGPALEEFKTPTAQRTRIEGSGVKQRRGRASPLDLLERIHGEILAGNRPLATETLRLGTNAVRTLVRRGELSLNEGRAITAELRAAAI